MTACLYHAGIGKSTLLGLISGQLEPMRGTVTRNPKVGLASVCASKSSLAVPLLCMQSSRSLCTPACKWYLWQAHLTRLLPRGCAPCLIIMKTCYKQPDSRPRLLTQQASTSAGKICFTVLDSRTRVCQTRLAAMPLCPADPHGHVFSAPCGWLGSGIDSPDLHGQGLCSRSHHQGAGDQVTCHAQHDPSTGQLAEACVYCQVEMSRTQQCMCQAVLAAADSYMRFERHKVMSLGHEIPLTLCAPRQHACT